MEKEPQKQEKSFEESLFDSEDSKQREAVRDIFNRDDEMHSSTLGLIKDPGQQAEIINLVAEYGTTNDFSTKKKIREKVADLLDKVWEEAHKRAA